MGKIRKGEPQKQTLVYLVLPFFSCLMPVCIQLFELMLLDQGFQDRKEVWVQEERVPYALNTNEI